MDPVTVLIGVAAMAYGLYTAWARRAKPEQFKKLESMKKAWGETGGQMVHIVGYTLAPIIVGVVLVLGGLRGVSLF